MAGRPDPPPPPGATRRRLHGILLPGLVAALLPALLPAQTPTLERYSTLDGIPQNQILALYQDADGYLWMGSYGGLTRYDGSRFTTYTALDGLPSNTVRVIEGDAGGRLAVGMVGGGVCFFEDGEVDCPAVPVEGPATEDVEDLLVGSDGALWVATEEGLTRLPPPGASGEGAGGAAVRHFGTDDGLPAGPVHVLHQDDVGRIWAGTPSGLVRLEDGRFTLAWPERLSGENVTLVQQVPMGILVGTDSGLHLAHADRIVELEIPELPGATGFSEAAVDSAGSLWVGTRHGVLRLEGPEIDLLDRSDGLPSETVNRVLVDREGTVWLGTEAGLAKLVPGPFEVYTEADGLPHPTVRTLAEDGAGRLWIGTRAGVAVRGPDGGIRTGIPAGALPHPWVYAVSTGPGGELLVGTRRGLALTRDGTVLRTYGPDEGLPGAFVTALVPDGEGGVWVGTEGGLVRWEGGRIEEAGAPAPTGIFVVALRRDAAGRLWIGRRTGGVVVLSGDGVRHLGPEDGLTDQTVWSIDFDERGRAWIGTNGHGLYGVGPEEGVRHLTTRDGLASNFVWSVQADDDGTVWLYTNRGLDRYRDGGFRHYGEGSGLGDREGSAGASLRASSGELWFGTAAGLVRYLPDRPTPTPGPPPVHVEAVESGVGLLEAGGEVPHDFGELTFRFVALSFRSERAVRYRHRLLGEGDRWSEPMPERSVSYGSLAPGRYEFQVRGSNHAGVWSDRVSFPFRVRPAFWQTWWFRGAGLLLLVGIGFAAYSWRTRHLQAERARLEELVRLRTGELEEKNESLEEEVAERRRAEEALRESRRRLREILEHSTNLFYSHTPDHELTYVSPQTRSFLDCEPEEALTRWTEFATDHPANRRGFELTEKAIRTGERQPPYELELEGAAGRRIWVRVNEAPVVRDGETVAIVGSLTDITERKEAEEDRERLERQLAQAQKLEAVGQLAGGVAHDFNNIMTSILGFADLASADLAPEHPARSDLEDIRASAQRAARLTRQLLAFSRKQAARPEVLDLNEVVREASEMFRGLIGEDIELVLDLDEGIEPVRIDPSQIDQILVNLAVNARDAMPGGGRLTISTGMREVGPGPGEVDGEGAPAGPHVLLAVRDTGRGMDEETRSRVFEPFFTTKEVGTGTGLGLATVYGIVKQNEGWISVESEPGEGTVFRILLPPASGGEASAGEEDGTGEGGGEEEGR